MPSFFFVNQMNFADYILTVLTYGVLACNVRSPISICIFIIFKVSFNSHVHIIKCLGENIVAAC